MSEILRDFGLSDGRYLSLPRLLVKVKPMKGRSLPENSDVLRVYRSSDGGACIFSNSSKLDVSSLLVMVGMKGGVAGKMQKNKRKVQNDTN